MVWTDKSKSVGGWALQRAWKQSKTIMTNRFGTIQKNCALMCWQLEPGVNETYSKVLLNESDLDDSELTKKLCHKVHTMSLKV